MSWSSIDRKGSVILSINRGVSYCLLTGECHAVYQEGSTILMTLPSGDAGMKLPSGNELPCSGLIQWARGDVRLKPSTSARPCFVHQPNTA